ncbi:MAG: acetylxylan esterase, partial [Alistipes sp.]|nr:acetylxylan esterase [Alistipes sp.]
MKTRLLTFCLLAFGIAALHAENNPYCSDMLWVTVPDHADWLYKTGEKATIEVQLYRYGIPQDGVTVDYEIGGDMMPADKSGSVVLKNGRAVIPLGTMKQPG